MKKKPSDDSSRKTEMHLNIWLLPACSGIFAILYGLTSYRGWLLFFIGVYARLADRSCLGELTRSQSAHRA